MDIVESGEASMLTTGAANLASVQWALWLPLPTSEDIWQKDFGWISGRWFSIWGPGCPGQSSAWDSPHFNFFGTTPSKQKAPRNQLDKEDQKNSNLGCGLVLNQTWLPYFECHLAFPRFQSSHPFYQSFPLSKSPSAYSRLYHQSLFISAYISWVCAPSAHPAEKVYGLKCPRQFYAILS